jgi:hypothetical protein
LRAKQSNPELQERLDCFVASLLATTAITSIHAFPVLKKTWMPGTSSAKTRFALQAGHDDDVGEDGKE